jgi:hypothetical protein
MTRWLPALGLLALLLGPDLAAASSHAPAAGSWATYRRTSSLTHSVPVLSQQATSGGPPTWSVSTEALPPSELFVTYGVVGADPRRYVLQIVTHATLDGPPLSVTQVTVDRASGQALRSVIRRPKGTIATPEDGLRPFRRAGLAGTPETVEVPAGRFEAVKAPYRDGSVWVADGAGPLGMVKLSGPRGTLELVRQGAGGARDLLRP